MLDLFHLLPNYFWLQCFIAIVATGLLAAWYFVQNRSFDFKNQRPNRLDYINLLRAARLRSWVSIIVISILFITLLFNNANNIIAARNSKPIRQEAGISELNNVENQASIEVIEADIFLSESELRLDEIKERYEDIIVTYLFLKQCHKLFEADYTDIQIALQNEVIGQNITTSFYENINSAALGSFEAIYSDSECDAEYVNQTHMQYKVMIAEMLR